MTTPVFAGIDGGGTKTVVVVVDAAGAECARTTCSTSNAAVVGHDAAGQVLREGLESALRIAGPQVLLQHAWFGLSGSDRPEDHRKLRPFVADLAPIIQMTNDAELVLGGLPDSVGVAIVSGTGSIAFGRNASGMRARSGGWGQVFGDEGSGYDLSRRMFDAFARETDGRGPSTSLTPRLSDELKLTEPHQLIAFVYAAGTTKGDLASLSRLVVDEANAGDPVALDIIAAAAGRLAETAAAAIRRLGFESKVSLALTGGMLVHIDPFRNAFLDGLRLEWPQLEYVIVDDPALVAARSLALSFKPGVVTS